MRQSCRCRFANRRADRAQPAPGEWLRPAPEWAWHSQGRTAHAELRATVGKLWNRNLAVVAFVDSGNVFHRVSELDLARLRTTVGFGTRWDSPLGPLRLDFGFKTDRMVFRNGPERRWEFHLSIGEVF